MRPFSKVIALWENVWQNTSEFTETRLIAINDVSTMNESREGFPSILAHLCPTLVAMATPLAPFLDSIFEITDPENRTIHTHKICVDILYKNEVMLI